MTVKYESSASYRFFEDRNYFITFDKNSLLIYDLDNRREHYIGNFGEYLIDKESEYIAYTISSKDKRGNGIYLYNPDDMITMALQTGNFIYSNLSWNHSKNMLAAYKYNYSNEKVDYPNMKIIVLSGVSNKTNKAEEYQVKDIEGIPENMGPAIKSGKYSSEITWSKDDERIFLKIKEYNQKDSNNVSDNEEAADVQIWHWKDKKLLSERITEYEKNKNKVFDAVFFRKKSKLVPLTSEGLQKLLFSKGTDRWAIGTDNREYLSDWDVSKNDLYRIDLKTGEKKLIEKKYSSRYSAGLEVSPDGKKVIMWDGEHYWCYDFDKDFKYNVSEKLRHFLCGQGI